MFCHLLWKATKFYWRLTSHIRSFLDLLLHGSGLSIDNHWQYHQCCHELFGRKSASFIFYIFRVIQYIDVQKQLVGSTLKMLAKSKSLETVVDEVHFIANLHSFLISSVSPGSPLGKSFVSSQVEQRPNLFPLLDTSTATLVCIFSLILNHSDANQKIIQ